MIGRQSQAGEEIAIRQKGHPTGMAASFVVSVCFRGHRTTGVAGDFARAIW